MHIHTHMHACTQACGCSPWTSSAIGWCLSAYDPRGLQPSTCSGLPSSANTISAYTYIHIDTFTHEVRVCIWKHLVDGVSTGITHGCACCTCARVVLGSVCVFFGCRVVHMPVCVLRACQSVIASVANVSCLRALEWPCLRSQPVLFV